jgi:outer membrane biosynthesis protein TonB
MNTYDYDENDEPGFFQKYGIAIGVAVVVLLAAGIGLSFYFFSDKIPPPKKPQEIMVHLEPPPPLPPSPPPPPPPKEPPPPEQKMVEQPPVNKPEEKPKDAPKSPDKPPGPPGPVASGPPSDFGLGGGGEGGGGIGGSGGGSKYGWYAGEVQAAITKALHNNEKTKSAALHLKVRVWADGTGRITRASLAGSSGDSAVDDAIKNQVLTGLNLPEAPPSDMPMPIVLRISELRPN